MSALVHPAGETAWHTKAELIHEQRHNWWWDYASMQAPDHNEMYYFKFTMLSIGYFFVMHLVIHYVAMRQTQIYRDLNLGKRTEYRTYVVSINHAIVAFFLSTISMWYICGNGQTVFNSEECIGTVRYIHIWALLHTCGYFLVDFFFLFFVIKGTSTLDYQTYAHHLIATVTFYQTLYFMDFMVVFGVMLLFIEASTVFMSLRWLLYTHNLSESKWYAINAVAMFLTFLICRLCFQLYIVFAYMAELIYAEYQKKNLTIYQGTVITEMTIMVILSIVLNSYWFMLMCKMIIRVLSRIGRPSIRAEPIEKIELVKADALAENEADCGNSTQGSNEGEIAEEAQNDPEIQKEKLEVLGMEV